MAWGIAGARDISLGIFPEVLMTPCPYFFSGHSHGELEEKPEEEGERLPASRKKRTGSSSIVAALAPESGPSLIAQLWP